MKLTLAQEEALWTLGGMTVGCLVAIAELVVAMIFLPGLGFWNLVIFAALLFVLAFGGVLIGSSIADKRKKEYHKKFFAQRSEKNSQGDK